MFTKQNTTEKPTSGKKFAYVALIGVAAVCASAWFNTNQTVDQADEVMAAFERYEGFSPKVSRAYCKSYNQLSIHSPSVDHCVGLVKNSIASGSCGAASGVFSYG